MDQNTDNVVQLGNQVAYPIFNPKLRKQIEASVNQYTEKPQDVVAAVESTICKFLVSAVRRSASKLGEALGKQITGKIDEVINE
jgi:hypothetical protein